MYSEFVVGECPFCMSEKKLGLCNGNFTEVFKGRDRVGFYIAGVGDGYTDHYYPKFCPECGRRINWDKDEKMKEEVERIAELRTLEAEKRMAELDKKIKESDKYLKDATDDTNDFMLNLAKEHIAELERELAEVKLKASIDTLPKPKPNNPGETIPPPACFNNE